MLVELSSSGERVPAPASVNLVSVLLLGLLAGGVSCAAVQGGLLAGLVSRQHRPGPDTPGTRPGPPAAIRTA